MEKLQGISNVKDFFSELLGIDCTKFVPDEIDEEKFVFFIKSFLDDPTVTSEFCKELAKYIFDGGFKEINLIPVQDYIKNFEEKSSYVKISIKMLIRGIKEDVICLKLVEKFMRELAKKALPSVIESLDGATSGFYKDIIKYVQEKKRKMEEVQSNKTQQEYLAKTPRIWLEWLRCGEWLNWYIIENGDNVIWVDMPIDFCSDSIGEQTEGVLEATSDLLYKFGKLLEDTDVLKMLTRDTDTKPHEQKNYYKARLK